MSVNVRPKLHLDFRPVPQVLFDTFKAVQSLELIRMTPIRFMVRIYLTFFFLYILGIASLGLKKIIKPPKQ